MKIVAIIAEYNPFHNGHAYQIREARRLFGDSCAILVIMSGSFTQRGEPALTDKWSRTRMALNCGADLVLELPFVFATASAERFAAGAVSLVKHSGLAATLFFGSEAGDLAALNAVADWLEPETKDFRDQLKLHLNEGHSFPRARQLSLYALTDNDERASLLASPNNILAIEYLKALKAQGANLIEPYTIRRSGQAYNDDTIQKGPLPASATAIRRAIKGFLTGPDAGNYRDLIDYLTRAMPDAALGELLMRLQDGPGPLFLTDFAVTLITLLLSRSPDELTAIAGMGEGLAQRLRQAAQTLNATGDQRIDQLIEEAKTKRFTRTRIMRALTALLLNVKTEDLKELNDGPAYLRVLGFSHNGRYMLRLMKQNATVPIITRASDFLEHGQDRTLTRMAGFDLAATDIWSVTAGLKSGLDFDSPVILI